MTAVETRPMTAASTELEIRIEGSREDVWQALTEEISTWWPKSFCSPRAAKFVLEPRPGGRLFEDWGDGHGMIWGTVITVDPGRKLQTVGDLFLDYDGPGRTYDSYVLEEEGSTTLVRFTTAVYAPDAAKSIECMGSGWELLLGKCLKAHVEGQPLPEPGVG